MRRAVAWASFAVALVAVCCAVIAIRIGLGGSLRNPALWVLPQRPREWHDRHDAKVAEARRRSGQVNLLFVGDSITQNYERAGDPPCCDFRPIWDQLFAPHGAMNLGFDADRTGNVLWRLQHGEVDGLAPRDIVLFIGTNNLNPTRLQPHGETSAQIVAGILAVMEELHRLMPAARVLVLSLLPSDFSAERMAKIQAVNAQLQQQLASFAYARWLDVSGIFMDQVRVRQDLFYDGVLYPGASAVHPTASAQRMMAQAIAQALYGR